MLYAFTAADAVSFFGNVCFVLCEAKQTGGCLNRRNIQSIQCGTHHRTTCNQLYGRVFFIETANGIYQISQCHTDSDFVVAGVFDTLTGNGNDSSHQRSALADCSFDCNNGIYVVYDTACGCGQCAGFYFSLCDSVNQVFFGALREFCYQRLNSDVINALACLLHGSDCFGLVHFDTDYALCVGMQLQHNLQTSYDSFGFFQHQAVVTCEVGLTFSRIDEDVIDGCVLGRVQFYVCRETCTTQTNNAGIFDCCQNFVICHGCVILTFVETFDLFHFAVVLYNDSLYHCTTGYEHRSDVYNFAGNGGEDRRRHECAGLSDFLSYLYMIANGNQWITRSTDVLAHRVEQLRVFFGHNHLDGLVFCQFFPIRRMYTTFER